MPPRCTKQNSPDVRRVDDLEVKSWVASWKLGVGETRGRVVSMDSRQQQSDDRGRPSMLVIRGKPRRGGWWEDQRGGYTAAFLSLLVQSALPKTGESL
ncbi:hypothetical protein VTI74DRAFT_6113 [Chaetomium olivicolor]